VPADVELCAVSDLLVVRFLGTVETVGVSIMM